MAKISGGKAGFSSGVVKAGSILISLAGITVEEVGEQLEMDNDSVPLVAVKEVRLVVVVVPKEEKKMRFLNAAHSSV